MTEQTPAVENLDPVLNIALKVTEINIVLAGLQELQFKIVDPILKSIISQAQIQLGQQPEIVSSVEEAA